MNQQKKENLITLLQTITPQIPELEGLLYLVEQQDLDESLIQSIEGVIEQAYHNTKNELQKQVFQKSLEIVKKIKTQEGEADEQELDKLLESIL